MALDIAQRSVSPLAAALALSLSGSPLDFFFRLHLRVVQIFHVLFLSLSAARLFGDGLQSHGLREEAVYFFLDGSDELFTVGAGAWRASVVSISSLSPI